LATLNQRGLSDLVLLDDFDRDLRVGIEILGDNRG
jgi:hypothetical protein